MPECVVCGGTDFYAEAGFYFCKECQTQNEDIREEVLEMKVDATTRLRKMRIRQDKSSTSERNQNLGWTTWEQYNFILIGLTNELMELGASLNIKMTILQLWAFYLGNLEVAFTTTTKTSIPRLSRKFHQRDAEIIYGKIVQRKKSRKRGTSNASNTSASSIVSGVLSEGSFNRDLNKHKKRMVAAEYERYVQSQDSSEGDALSVANQSLYSVQSSRSSAQTDDNIQFNKGAKKEINKVRVLSLKLPRLERLKYRRKHVTTQYTTGPQVITPMKLWSLIYLGLRIHDEDIHLADMLRFGREGHLSCYRLDHLLPPEVTLTRSETHLLRQTKEITHKSLRRTVAALAKYLDVWETRKPDFAVLLERYCTELQLPKGIIVYAERMMAMSPPKMDFNEKTPCFPNYEGRVMAFIVVTMKILFGLDGITEYTVSRVVEKINSTAAERGGLDTSLFSFSEWQRYIQCRRSVLANRHFPTKLKREPDSSGSSDLYLKFISSIKSKSSDREEPEVKSYKHVIPRELTDAMRTSIEKLHESTNPVTRDADFFGPSLTPQHSYLKQLLEDPEGDLPTNLRADFNSMEIGYVTNPEKLQALAQKYDIELEVADTALHFIEKIVPPFQQLNLPTIKELNEPVRVKHPLARKTLRAMPERESCEDAAEYLQRKNPGSLYVDSSKLADYELSRKSLRHRRREFVSDPPDDFGFDEIASSGKLAVGNDSNSDSESVHSFSTENCTEPEPKFDENAEFDNDFFAKYNISLSNFDKCIMSGNEIARIPKKAKRELKHDPVTGKFVSVDNPKKPENGKKVSSEPSGRNHSSRPEKDNEQPIAPAKWNESKNDLDDEAEEAIELRSSYDFARPDEVASILRGSDSCQRSSAICGSHFLDSSSGEKFEKFYRPYSEYWMYRCCFSRVKHKNFRQFERDLPDSFRWLLEECSSVVEMTEEDLYEEVCLVESYYVDILRPSNPPSSGERYDGESYRSKAHYNLVTKKW